MEMPTIPLANSEWSLFFGCLLMTFSPILSLFLFMISKRAQLVIISLTSAFIWLCSILFTATLWTIIPGLKNSIYTTLPLSILIQESSRYLFFRLYLKGEDAIHRMVLESESKAQLPLNDITSSIAAGVGFALMQSLMMYGTVLAASLDGQGAAFSNACPSLPLVFLSGLFALAFSIMNVAWMVMGFYAYRHGSILYSMLMIGLHLTAGCLVRC